MSRSSRRIALAVACALALVPASAARAEVVETPVPLASPANGVAAGADGNVYVVEQFNNSVAVLSPAGQLVRRVALPGASGAATSAQLGPDGRVWVAITTTGAGRGFQRIDPSGTLTSLATLHACGPVGMAVFNATRMLYTAPDPGNACGVGYGVGGINGDGSGREDVQRAFNAFDLAVVSGKAFVPDFNGDVVRRYEIMGNGTWGAFEVDHSTPVGAGPNGIEVGPGGQLYVTLGNSGQVARLDPAANNHTTATIVASDLKDPYGMALGADGALYVASQDARLLRIGSDGSQRFIALPAGFAAWQVARAGNDIWATDNGNARAIRVRNAGLPEPQPPVTTPPVTTPPVTTPPPATPKPAAKPKVADVVSLATPRKCLSKRRLTLTVKKPKAGAAKVSSVKVTIGKGKAKTYTAKKLKVPVTLSGLPKGTFKVKLSVKLSDGTTLTETRTYKTCAAKAKKKG